MHPELIGGRYRVARAIGQGGMGTVWLCRDETLQRDVAVKQVGLLPGESVTDSARAMREARSSAALSHRNVVTVFDVVEEAGSIWLVMEHVPSKSLADLIRDDGPLEPRAVANIGAQVADGLAASHAVGTMHRDVKPGNILVRADGVAKISDFGIARSAGDATLTQAGFLTGTPGYFSPEIARGGEPAPAADVWALGATLYAAVEGRPPYDTQQNAMAVLHDIATQQPPRPANAGALEPLLLQMLDRDPDSRWSMSEAAESLRRVADGRPAEPTRVTPVPVAAGGDHDERPAGPVPPPDGEGGERRRPAWLLPLLAVLGLVLVVLLVLWLTQRTSPDDTSARGGSSPTTSSSETPTGSPSDSSGSSPTPSDPSDTPTPSPSASATGPSSSPTQSSPTASNGGGTGGGSGGGSSAAAKESFLRRYFAVAPGGTDAAWAMLGPAEQAQGRSGYDGFWSGIASVDVSEVSASSGKDDTVDATLTYTRVDGSTSTERHRLQLIRSGGDYLINGDEPTG